MSKRDWSQLIGRRFSMLVATAIGPNGKHRRLVCRCDCGSQGFSTAAGHIERGKIWCCGCRKNHVKDIAGRRFGRLVVLRLAEARRNGGSVWWCRCDCGVEKEIRKESLVKKTGNTVSCGCFHRENTSAIQTKHGATKRTRSSEQRRNDLYFTWVQMRHRCNSPKNDGYENYGGRGIRVDPRWDDYATFRADMGPKPGPNYSLERVDNNGNYEPGNVIWATRMTQSRNKRNNRMITHNGRTMCMTDWAIEKKIKVVTVQWRLRTKSIAESLETPVGMKLVKGGVTHNGRTMSIADWAREKGMSPGVLAARIRAKKPIEDAIETPVATSHLKDVITHDGRTMRVADWAREKGIDRHTLGARLRRANRSIAECIETPVGASGRKKVGA